MGTNLVQRPLDEVAARLEDIRDRAGDLLEPLGIASLPAQPLLLRQPRTADFDWVVLPLLDDPLFKRGELDIPPQERRRLRLLEERGVEFDELLIAHEVPKRAIAAPEHLTDPVLLEKVLRPPGLKPDRRSGRVLRRFLEIGALGSGAAVAGAALITVGGVAVAAATLVAADPVLIGAITPDGTAAPGTPAALFVLARW